MNQVFSCWVSVFVCSNLKFATSERERLYSSEKQKGQDT